MKYEFFFESFYFSCIIFLMSAWFFQDFSPTICVSVCVTMLFYKDKM